MSRKSILLTVEHKLAVKLIDFLGFNLFVVIWNRIRWQIKYGNTATYFLFILHDVLFHN